MSKKKKPQRPPSFDGFAKLVDNAQIIFVPRQTLTVVDGQLVEINCPATLVVHGEIGGCIRWNVVRKPKLAAVVRGEKRKGKNHTNPRAGGAKGV